MSRLSIVLLLLLCIGGASAGTYLLVFPRVEVIVQDEAKDGLRTAARLMEKVERENESKLLSQMISCSKRENLLKLLASRPGVADSTGQWLDDLRVEIAGLTAFIRNFATISDMYILDTTGKGLARNEDMHWTGQRPSEDKSVLDAIKSACEGKDRMVLFASPRGVSRAMAVPVGDDGKLLGVLLGFFPLDVSEMRLRKSLIESDVDVAVVAGGKITASSLEKVRHIEIEKFFSDHADLMGKVMSGVASGLEVKNVEGLDAYVAGVPLETESLGANNPLGLLLVRWTDSVSAPMKEIVLYFFSGMAILLLFMSFLVILVGGSLVRNLKALEGDLLEVVNSGKTRPVKATGPAVVKSIAHLCSELILGQAGESEQQSQPGLSLDGVEKASVKNVECEDEDESLKKSRTGKDEEDEEPLQISKDSNGRGASDREPLADYYASLYSEFCSAKKELGENVDKLNLGRFRAKLEKQARNIRNKCCCRDVKFEVLVKSGKVSLHPKIVR